MKHKSRYQLKKKPWAYSILVTLMLTVILHKRNDHSPGVGQEFTGVHLPASVLPLGEVDLQLVHQGLRVHLGQVGD